MKKQHHNQEYWEEIFNEIDMDFIPLEYIKVVIVRFLDGNIWEIDLAKSKHEVDDVEVTLADFFEEYDGQIDSVDFRLNTEQLQRDISKRTARFLKLNK